MSKRNKKGFSIVEAIIALSIIVAVSITALSVVVSSITTKVAAINKTEAQNFAYNVWESFKAAENEEEFISLVNFAEGITLTDGVPDENNVNVYTYYSEENNFTALVSVKYSATERPEFKIDVADNKGKEIISFSYRKGDEI